MAEEAKAKKRKQVAGAYAVLAVHEAGKGHAMEMFSIQAGNLKDRDACRRWVRDHGTHDQMYQAAVFRGHRMKCHIETVAQRSVMVVGESQESEES